MFVTIVQTPSRFALCKLTFRSFRYRRSFSPWRELLQILSALQADAPFLIATQA
jgi:hypothetical protein